MTVRELKELLEQFDDEETVVIADYAEEDSDGNMPCHTINGIERLRGWGEEYQPVLALHFNSQD